MKVQQKHLDGASLGEEKAPLDCLMTKNGPKWVWKGLADLSTISDGSTTALRVARGSQFAKGHAHSDVGEVHDAQGGVHRLDLAQPDQAIFDLDPGAIATVNDVREAALRLRDKLERPAIRS